MSATPQALPNLPKTEILRSAIRSACDVTGISPTAVGMAVAGDGKVLTQFLKGGRKPSYERMVDIVQFLHSMGAPCEGETAEDPQDHSSVSSAVAVPQGNKVSEGTA